MRLAFLLLLLAAMPASAQGTGTLAGTVFEADSVTAAIGAIVRIQGTTLGAATDIDGRFRIIDIPTGTYNIVGSFNGYSNVRVSVVSVRKDETTCLDLTFSEIAAFIEIDDREIGRPLVSSDVYAPRILSWDEIERMPVNR